MPRKPHTLAAGPISTAASARCSDTRSLGQLLQQFVAQVGKPLKRLFGVHPLPHRAKAAVLMRGARVGYGPFGLGAPITALVLGLAGPLPAQTFRTLYTFPQGYGGGVSIVSGNTLYGPQSGTAGHDAGGFTIVSDAIFAVNTDGTGFRTLHSFEPAKHSFDLGWTNSDGIGPQRLILSGNTLYGNCTDGGPWGKGTIFAVNTNGTGFTALHIFSGSDGCHPVALSLSGSTLYGTTVGGSEGEADCQGDYGTVFTINTDGTGFTTLYRFTGGTDGLDPRWAIPSGNTLYGTCAQGGPWGYGTIFAVNTDGTGFTALYSFSAPSTNSFGSWTNSDGYGPNGGLILSGSTLYGTCAGGGLWGNGTIFAVNTDGTGFRTLYSFSATDTNGTNIDGAYPVNVVLSDNTLFGTSIRGGLGHGTIFAVNTDGTGFTNPLNLDLPNEAGVWGPGDLFVSNNTLYGTLFGATSSTIFSLPLSIGQPQLTITPSATNIILTWSTNFSGFTLQSATNLGSSAVWTTNSPAPVIVNGQNTVTNPISGTQQFYRLIQ